MLRLLILGHCLALWVVSQAQGVFNVTGQTCWLCCHLFAYEVYQILFQPVLLEGLSLGRVPVKNEKEVFGARYRHIQQFELSAHLRELAVNCVYEVAIALEFKDAGDFIVAFCLHTLRVDRRLFVVIGNKGSFVAFKHVKVLDSLPIHFSDPALLDNNFVQQLPLACTGAVIEKVEQYHVVKLKTLRLIHRQTKHVLHEFGYIRLCLLIAHDHDLSGSELLPLLILKTRVPFASVHQKLVQESSERFYILEFLDHDWFGPTALTGLLQQFVYSSGKNQLQQAHN